MKLTLDQALQKGIEAYKAGKVQEAYRYYTFILKANSKHPDTNHNMGALAVDVGKAQEALPFFKTALEANPSNAQFWLSYINALIKLGRLADAKTAFHQAKSKGIKGNYSYDIQKRIAELDKDLQVNGTAAKSDEPCTEHLQNLINLYSHGRSQEALNQASQLLEKFPKSINLHNIIGAAYKGLGNLDKAIEAYKNALSIKPDVADIHNNLGNALKGQGKLEEAIQAYNQALSIGPELVETLYNMGNALRDLGKPVEAIEAYNKALAIKPEYTDVWYNLYFPLHAIKTKIPPVKNINLLYPNDARSNYAKIEIGILDYKLHRGQQSEGIYLDKAISILSIADNITIQNPKFDKKTQGKTRVLSDKMLALTHFGRSGTGLMHSLIDGHPEVSTLPSIYFSEYFNHSTWTKIISNGWNGMVDQFIAIYDVLFDATSPKPIETKSKKLNYNIGVKEGMTSVGKQRNEILKVDKGLFKKELEHLMTCYKKLDAFSFFQLVHSAYNVAVNDHNLKSLTFYHIHNPDVYAQLNFVRFNPKTKWVVMVRDPLQSCESWVRKPFLKKNYFGVVSRILAMLFEIDNIVLSKQNAIGVRLEDIKARPRKTIPAFCNWIGIKEEDTLYEMTAQGKKWWGDPSSPDYKKDGQNPFGKNSINRKIGSIFSENDQLVLHTLFYPFSVRFGYTEANATQFENDLKKIRPMIDEMFCFEKEIAKKMQMSAKKFMGSGSYLHFRSGLIQRWNTLNEFRTYPNMIGPLKI